MFQGFRPDYCTLSAEITRTLRLRAVRGKAPCTTSHALVLLLSHAHGVTDPQSQ